MRRILLNFISVRYKKSKKHKISIFFKMTRKNHIAHVLHAFHQNGLSPVFTKSDTIFRLGQFDTVYFDLWTIEVATSN